MTDVFDQNNTYRKMPVSSGPLGRSDNSPASDFFNTDYFRQLFDHMPMGIACHQIVTDENGRPLDYIFLQANSAFESQTGLLAQQVLNRRVTEVLPEIRNASPDLISLYGEVALTGKTKTFETYFAPLNRYYQITAYSPQEGLFVTLFHDISHLKATERERTRLTDQLRHERDLLQTFLDSPHNVHLAYLDTDFDFVRVNQIYARGSGHKPQDLIGRNHFNLFPNKENERIFRRVRDSGREEIFHDKPFTFPDQPDRGITYWDWILTPTKDAGGKVTGLILALTETTERKRAEAELRIRADELAAANRELETFSYSVSHDLRSPLRTMKGFSDILLEDHGDQLDETARDYLQRIKASADRMNAIIEDMLSLSRISRHEMAIQTIDLTGMARDILAELRERQPERDVDVTIGENLAARGDQRLLRIALTNLLGNAWKYTGKTAKARIEMGSCRAEDGTIFFVRDNGAGFPMQFADKLFKPFQRLHTESEFAGTGIGLAIVERVIRRHRGKIWAEGEAGKGAAFYFSLP